jgi:MinD-like ATPase involved in chromosome partitioning or flagellar assembly
MDDLIYLPNRVSSSKAGKKLFESVNYVTTKFLHKDLEYIGSISEDSLYCHVWDSTKPKGIIKSSSSAYAELSAIVSEIERHSAFNSEEGSKGLSFFLDGFTS